MFKLKRSVPMVLVMVLLAVLDATAQDEPVEKIETAIANIPVVATDSVGRAVSGLTIEDFEVSINGEKQHIDFFDNNGPVNIVIIVDANSNTAEVLDQIKRDAQNFIDQLGPNEYAMVMKLDMGYKVLCELTTDRRKLRAAVGKIDSHRDRARLMDAVLHQAIFYELAEARGKKAVVVFGDADSAIAWYDIKADDTDFQPNFMAESDAAVYPIFYQTYSVPRHLIGKTMTYDQLLQIPPIKNFYYYSSLTGGRFYAAGTENFKTAFNEILDSLRNQYVLGIYLDTESYKKRSEISVTATKQGIKIRTKQAVRARNTKERQRWIERMMVQRQK